jgi:cytochrome oxidase Cu insertion factor (SCO1/SenC/PrrC family)
MGKRRLVRAPSGKDKQEAKSRWTTWAWVGGSAVAIGVIIALVMMQTGTKAASGIARVGRPAPDFTLRLLNGQSVSLASLKGKPVLVNFWHSS